VAVPAVEVSPHAIPQSLACQEFAASGRSPGANTTVSRTAGEGTDMPERSAARGGVDIDLLQGDIAKVQEWLGDANIATTRIYDHRKTRPEDSILENRRERLSFLKLGETVQIFHAPKIVNEPLSTT